MGCTSSLSILYQKHGRFVTPSKRVQWSLLHPGDTLRRVADSIPTILVRAKGNLGRQAGRVVKILICDGLYWKPILFDDA